MPPISLTTMNFSIQMRESQDCRMFLELQLLTGTNGLSMLETFHKDNYSSHQYVYDQINVSTIARAV